MAQTKKKVATKTAAKSVKVAKKPCCNKKACQSKQEKPTNNMFFVISMTFLAATLLFADLIMIMA